MNAVPKWCAASYLVRESSGSFTAPNFCLVLPAIRFAERIKMEGDRERYRAVRCAVNVVHYRGERNGARRGRYCEQFVTAPRLPAAAWPSVFGDSPGAAALQHREIVIKVSLRDRLCQVVSHCLDHGHLRRD